MVTTRAQSRQRAVEMGHRFSEWSGMTGLQCNYCGAFHIDQAHEWGKTAAAREAFMRQHGDCPKPAL